MKKTLAIAGLALWIFGSGWYYTCKIKDRCYNGSSPGQADLSGSLAGYPLLFDWESEEPLTGAGFSAWKDSLSALLKPGNTLQLSGLYSLTETNLTGEKDLGLARAKRVRGLFADIPDSLISLISMEDSRLSYEEGNQLPAILAEIISAEKVKVPDAVIPDNYIIYFRSNSAEKIADPKVDQYLDNLAISLKNSAKTVEIIGHTDNIGSNQVNLTMGLIRAETIRSVLVAKGIPASQVAVSSKGEEQPAGPNNTEEGRAKNRRTEIIVK